MGSDGQQVKMALLHWVNTFDMGGSPHTIRCFEELSDGIIVYKILLEIDPAFFRSAVGATPVENGLSNWVLRLNNAKRIYKFLERYYEEKQNQSLADLDTDIPNLEAIAKNSSEEELVKLLKIVLRCSFFRDNREKSMKRMKNLDSQVQAVLEQVNSEVAGLKKKVNLDTKIEKKTLSFDEEIAIVNKEKDILKKNYELILEENVILRENQKTMKSKLNSVNEELNKAENLITDYESQISHLQMQVDQFEYELNQYKDSCLQKDLEIERQNEIIISLTHQKEELKTGEHVLLRSELQREKQSLEEDRSLVFMYEQKLEDSDILSQDEILNLENISYRKNNKIYVSIDSENIVKDDILESKSHRTPCNKLIKETSELKAEYFKNDSKTKENEIHSFYEKINVSQQSKEDFHDYSEKSFKDLDHELKRQSNPYSDSETSQFQQESDMLKKRPSEKSIVVIKNLINNLKKSKDKTEDKHFEKEEKKNELDDQIHNDNNKFLKDLKLNSSSIPFKIDTIPEIQIQELENLDILKENSHVIKQQINKENICDLVLTYESDESRKLQVELSKLKKSIKDLEDENQHQINIINELHEEKDTLMNELIIDKDLLSNQQQENDKLNSIITSISEAIDQERKKQLEAQEKIEKLQNELDQRITGALKAKQLLKKQDSIIKEYKEKMALCKSTDELYNELVLKNKEIEELKKINDEEITKLKEENARMIDAWYNLTSHMQQKSPTVQHTFIQSPGSLD